MPRQLVQAKTEPVGDKYTLIFSVPQQGTISIGEDVSNFKMLLIVGSLYLIKLPFQRCSPLASHSGNAINCVASAGVTTWAIVRDQSS